jgi:hypothetical protein
MEFKGRRMLFLLAGPVIAAVTAVTVAACGGGSAPAVGQGSAPGHWTQTEVSEFDTSASSDGSSTDSCIAGYFERDMSFGNAMAVGIVSSWGSTSGSQVEAALVAKYGITEGDAIYSQYQQAVGDSVSNCGG